MKEPVFIKSPQFPQPLALSLTRAQQGLPLVDWSQVCETLDGVACGSLELVVPENTEQEWVFIQNLPANTKAATRIQVRLKRDARAHIVLIQRGAEHAQIEFQGICEGKGSELTVRGLQETSGKQKHAIQVNVVHPAAHTKSDLRVWCVGRDQGHSVFQGKVELLAGAHQVEAFQRNQNLLLSKTATMDSFPKLFISHDEVKAAHGASVSTIDPDQMAYLQSRGIATGDAEKMVTEGFIHQVVEELKDATLKAEVEKLLGLANRAAEAAEWETP